MSTRRSSLAAWLRDRSLTLTMLGLFAVCAAGQVLAGWFEFNQTATSHGERAIPLSAYVTRGHMWEALFENWESEFLQMSAFVVLSAYLYQVGSPESRRPGAHELSDADPRAFRDQPDAPWAVRRGGWAEQRLHGQAAGTLLPESKPVHAPHAETGSLTDVRVWAGGRQGSPRTSGPRIRHRPGKSRRGPARAPWP